MNLDPDGTSFWTGDLSNGTITHVDIASGTILGQFNSLPGTQLAGLAIVGEIAVSTPTLTLAPATQTQTVGVERRSHGDARHQQRAHVRGGDSVLGQWRQHRLGVDHHRCQRQCSVLLHRHQPGHRHRHRVL